MDDLRLTNASALVAAAADTLKEAAARETVKIVANAMDSILFFIVFLPFFSDFLIMYFHAMQHFDKGGIIVVDNLAVPDVQLCNLCHIFFI